MEALPAVILRECVVDVLSPGNKSGGGSTRNHPQFEQRHVVGHVPPNINMSHDRVQLFVVEK